MESSHGEDNSQSGCLNLIITNFQHRSTKTSLYRLARALVAHVEQVSGFQDSRYNRAPAIPGGFSAGRWPWFCANQWFHA
jgi:hypothetical protein